MEIVLHGALPNIKITLQSENCSELRELLFNLDTMSRQVGYLTINDIFNRSGHIGPICYAYSKLGWDGPTCFGNGPLGEKKSLYKDVKVFYYNCAPTIKLDDHSESPEFKAALPKAAKDAKIQKAYNVLTEAYINADSETDIEDLCDAMEEAIGYLGEVLE